MLPVTDLSRRAQQRLGAALRARVAGDDAAQRAAVIWGKPGQRWFTPQDPVWRVHADASMFPGGVAALLLQSLHPLAMAGVAGHSGYRGDPWGRLQRTSHFLATTTFGTIADAAQTIARVRSIPERVRGRGERGRAYRASDPDLLSWVHVAEAYSFLTAYQRFAVEPLTATEADTYVEQAAVVARLLGATEVPTTVAGLERALTANRAASSSACNSATCPPSSGRAVVWSRHSRFHAAAASPGNSSVNTGAAFAPQTRPFAQSPQPAGSFVSGHAHMALAVAGACLSGTPRRGLVVLWGSRS